MKTLDATAYFDPVGRPPAPPERVSAMAHELVASEILRIAGEIRALVADGKQVLNLTVGDFRSAQFPVPKVLSEGIQKALRDGQTHYPPATGVPECRQAVRGLFRDQLALDYPLESVLIAGGARPMIAGTYLALVDPGDNVVYALPSWNNNHYCTLRRAKRVEIRTTPETRFFPRLADIEPHISSARLICLNTPLNPTGTVMDPAELEALCRGIVDENQRREARGQRALYLMFDQVYWMLTFRDAQHVTPPGLVPEMVRYTIFVDGISKSFAATGLRVGWAVGPPDIIERMAAIPTHVGAWAPRPAQMATAELLSNPAAIETYRAKMRPEILARLDILAGGIKALADEGHDVEAIDPAGAIYLSLRLGVAGKRTPAGERLETDDDIRTYLLDAAGVGLVPFFCFGLDDHSGWFRASVGAVSKADCEAVIANLGAALRKLT